MLSIKYLPFAVERMFSEMSDLLTKKRNRLQEMSIDSCVVLSGFLKATSTTCETFPLNESYLTTGFNASAEYKVKIKADQEEYAHKEKEHE